MRSFAVVQMVAGVVLALVSPVASEMSRGLSVGLLAVGCAAVTGGVGILRDRRWGAWLSLFACVAFAVPILIMAGVIAVDLARRTTSWSSAGGSYLVAALVPPIAAIAILARHLRSGRATSPGT